MWLKRRQKTQWLFLLWCCCRHIIRIGLSSSTFAAANISSANTQRWAALTGSFRNQNIGVMRSVSHCFYKQIFKTSVESLYQPFLAIRFISQVHVHFIHNNNRSLKHFRCTRGCVQEQRWKSSVFFIIALFSSERCLGLIHPLSFSLLRYHNLYTFFGQCDVIFYLTSF